jgi:thiol-disulfide isomerase/thioredoxin
MKPDSRLMIAILAIALLATLTTAACEDDAKAPTGKRSEAVAAPKPSASTSALAAKSAPNAPNASNAASAPKPPRRLCLPPAADGKSLPAAKLDHVEAAGATPVADRVATGGGKWTWVNLWAAWCAPCREEIPRLQAFAKRFTSAGVPIQLEFVSLDDDERQARKFLGEQPAAGLRASHWLPDGGARTAFLESAKLKSDAALPIQVLVDPNGAIRCVIDGAVEETDYAQLEAWLKGR